MVPALSASAGIGYDHRELRESGPWRTGYHSELLTADGAVETFGSAVDDAPSVPFAGSFVLTEPAALADLTAWVPADEQTITFLIGDGDASESYAGVGVGEACDPLPPPTGLPAPECYFACE